MEVRPNSAAPPSYSSVELASALSSVNGSSSPESIAELDTQLRALSAYGRTATFALVDAAISGLVSASNAISATLISDTCSMALSEAQRARGAGIAAPLHALAADAFRSLLASSSPLAAAALHPFQPPPCPGLPATRPGPPP